MYTLGDSISIFNCIDVQQELIKYIEECTDECFIDATFLADIDASGVQLLISLKKYCERNNLSFRMINIQNPMITILTKLGLETLLVKEKI